MKRRIAALLALIWALSGLALAEDGWPGASLGRMRVVNCEEWVSLRASPDTSAEALARVPLNMWVSKCAPAEGDFISCEYNDGSAVLRGYIVASYLKGADFALRTASEGAQGTVIRTSTSEFGEGAWTFSDAAGAHELRCARDYGDDGERLYVSCFDADGGFVWGLFTESVTASELDHTDAYLGGTADAPLALVHNTDLGLVAIDMATGSARWTVGAGEVDLGASQTQVVDEDGTLYVGGYYGPSPVAISANGEVLWQSDAGENAVWLYGLRIEGDALVGDYEAPDDESYTRVAFDLATGAVLEAE